MPVLPQLFVAVRQRSQPRARDEVATRMCGLHAPESAVVGAVHHDQEMYECSQWVVAAHRRARGVELPVQLLCRPRRPPTPAADARDDLVREAVGLMSGRVRLGLAYRQVGRQHAAASAGLGSRVQTPELAVERGCVGLVEEGPEFVVRHDVGVVDVAQQMG